MIAIVNQILSILTIIGQIAIVFVIVSLVLKKQKSVLDLIARQAILFAFIIALVVTLGSLFYSEIAGYEPCKLCWFQRIFMYPQTILLGIALWRKDHSVALYSGTLAAIGSLIAGYHYLLQIGFAPSLPCSAVGYSISCSQIFVMQFGYITIPMMALTAFVLITLLMVLKTLGKNFKISDIK